MSKTQIIVGLVVLAAIVEGLVPGKVMYLPGVIVILGLIYGAVSLDPEDATAVLVVAIAVGAATSGVGMERPGGDATGVLTHIPRIGGYLDAIVDQVALALYGSVISVMVLRLINRLKGS